MSRVAKKPIVLPQGVAVDISSDQISVTGPLGALKFAVNPAVSVALEDGSLLCKPVAGVAEAVAMSGTMRAVLANMVTGVSAGFERKLSLVGVGYRAQAQGDTLNLTLGFSHPVAYKLPSGITATTPIQTEIVIKGVDRQLVGQVAAEVRAYRPPEPYKGKGVRYVDEVVVIKETKKKK
ncbi:MAG: 50S ribosomal protein L6 [Candidatus Accumulibacter regalis]|jgi:large subunit ribosomal protein L6|uniref:Large ribosomal subunit protein uL6 n=1 Tax=Accumulibacter regalis TaxID=522306 RepID=A0A011PTW7_ACCRE|nr:50S ribosomal protein L6 [Accumulibacter sp.]EXI90846.1 MAG: 50S ribosomal protein L6 [Candidatus Accumulibacter regalis]MQM35136.1 50S ribosomal protein L6 [Candidatus Accumulibacter phosphatis]MBN8514358.1 50S ribosomal protein L6 [Accumulibacter sp.]HRE68981.1 50S ribosomal protein L6 [Accumulibacter sp.]HRI91514.1 50S ribosomal protein L6 [Accumulibacter sp.]